jgi:hypothetical protein
LSATSSARAQVVVVVVVAVPSLPSVPCAFRSTELVLVRVFRPQCSSSNSVVRIKDRRLGILSLASQLAIAIYIIV